jgi:hypothetical protein
VLEKSRTWLLGVTAELVVVAEEHRRAGRRAETGDILRPLKADRRREEVLCFILVASRSGLPELAELRRDRKAGNVWLHQGIIAIRDEAQKVERLCLCQPIDLSVGAWSELELDPPH